MRNNDTLPVIIYVHGFMSGSKGAKQKQLQNHFKNRYRVIAPELDADPDNSLVLLNEIITKEKPEIIIGTSLGGWMTYMCESGDAKLIIVNPSTTPYKTLGRWLNQELTYFCPRVDGVQTYRLTQETLDKYKKYDTVSTIKEKLKRIHALCSTKDELIGQEHIEVLTAILPLDRLMIVDDFGHQCRDAGMVHLYNIIEKITHH